MLLEHGDECEHVKPGHVVLETIRTGISRWDQVFLCKLCHFWTYSLSLMKQHAIKHHLKKVSHNIVEVSVVICLLLCVIYMDVA